MMEPPLQIRVATTSDSETIATIYAPIVRDTAISFETEPPSTEIIARRIAETISQLPWLVAERDQKVIGLAYASKHRERAAYRWSVDVSAYVHEEARRRGVGRTLYERLLGIVRNQGFHAAFAGIALPNAASVGLHEAAGFKPLGVYREVGFKHGQWHDVGWWQMQLSESISPGEPIPFAQIGNKLTF
jgi:phosphinothricin acetyltransferase